MNHIRVTALRSICVLLCLVVIVSLSLPVNARMELPEHLPDRAVAVYYQPRTNGMIIGYLLHNTNIIVTGETEFFYQIDCYDMTGYLPKEAVRIEQEEYYVNYRIGHTEPCVYSHFTSSDATALRIRLCELAREQEGVPYVTGGTSPRGFDCSGFTQYVYAKAGQVIPRSCDAQMTSGIIISKEDLVPGDLVVFTRTTGAPSLATHVGLYLGQGKLIHAGSRGITIVDLDSAYFTEHYLCARRLISHDCLRYGKFQIIPLKNSK